MDKARAALIGDLKERGMLDETPIVWMGEFRRTPRNGDNHNPSGWTTLWVGGGLKPGQGVGCASDQGKIVDHPISLTDYMTTLCMALGINTHVEFDGPGNRPMPIVEPNANPIREILA